MGKFEFNGVSTEDLGLVVQTPPTYVFPERDVSSVHVPGRNGDLYIDNNCYKNVERSYSIAKGFRTNTKYASNSEEILAWLNSAKGSYVKLQDSYDPDVYRMATFVSSGSFTNIWDGALSIDVSFQCKPQRYLISGESPIYEEGPILEIENDYHYSSLPKIIIDGLSSVLTYSDDILMLSTINKIDNNPNNDKIISSVTINNFESDKLILDSDQQTAVTIDNNLEKDVLSYIGLNGLPFPKLEDKKSVLELKKYIMDIYSENALDTQHQIPKYSYILSLNQTVVKSKWMPKAFIEDKNQKKIAVIPYENLIAKNREMYPANSVQSYYENEVAEKYTFESYNDILNGNEETRSISFTGGWSDNDWSSVSDWLDAPQPSSGDKITIKVPSGKFGFYFIKGKDSKIKFYNSGQTILSNISESSITTIYYYAANAPETVGGVYTLKANYTDLGSDPWLKLIISYDNDNSPKKIQFATAKDGYIWKDKEGLFDKAKWQYMTSNTVLNTLSWSSDKKAFVSTSGLSTSTTKTFTYKYIKIEDGKIPQYKNITDIRVRDDGSKEPIVVAICRFTIEEYLGNTDLTQITIKAKDAGYYAYSLNGNDDAISSWKQCNVGAEIITPSLKGTDSFTIYYLEEIPTYYSEDWPDWLNPEPIREPSDLNPEQISFQVLEDGFYRWSYYDEDGNELYTNWEEFEAGNDLDLDQSVSQGLTICKIASEPSEADFDRIYYDIEDNEIEKPTWLKIQYFRNNTLTTEIDAEEYIRLRDEDLLSDVVIKYSALEDGYFKWDTDETWKQKTINSELLVSSYKDDTIFYYMEEIPQYEDFGYEYNLFDVVATAINGNPDLVTFTAKIRGYYRVNNNADWKDYKIGDTLIQSKIGESNTIRYLVPQSDELSELSITIIPRWWML